MKTRRFFALVGLLSICTLFQPTLARIDQINSDNIPNYVVIGAFSKQKNAVRFTDHAHKDLKLNAKFEMNISRNLYYVYVLSTNDLAAAIQEARRLREESEFRDTWVYRGSFKGDLGTSIGANSAALDINPISSVKPDEATGVPPTSATTDVAEPSSTLPTVTSPSATSPTPATADSTTSDADLVEDSNTSRAVVDDGTEGTPFLFKIARVTDQKRIRGDVDVVDVDRMRKMGTFKGNMTVKVASPASKSGKMSVICEVFGYRKVQRDLNFNDPESEEGIIRDASGAVVVPFELTRLKKGDIAVMYNVYFFKDASIMRPESRYEVNSLLEMLNENKKYKIKLHGHTNGGAAGKVISMNKDGQNFFSLTDTKEGFGSAKQLSEERAGIIRNYLIANGIDAKRMEIKAWGGKKPIHDKMSNRAQENVRVEVEILED